MENDIDQMRAHLHVQRLREEFEGPNHLLTTSDEIPAKDKTMIVIPEVKYAEYPPGSWTQLIDWFNARYSR